MGRREAGDQRLKGNRNQPAVGLSEICPQGKANVLSGLVKRIVIMLELRSQQSGNVLRLIAAQQVLDETHKVLS